MLSNEDALKLKTIVLMNDDKSLSLNINFFGYTQDAIEKYINKNFIECKKPYAEKYTQLKWM